MKNTYLLPAILAFLFHLPAQRISGQASLNPRVPDVYYQLENACLSGEYATCLNLEKSAVKTFEGKMDTLTANSFFYLGEANYYEGNLEKALGYYEKELELRKIMDGNTSIPYGESLATLAMALAGSGDYLRAESRYLELLPIDRKNYGVNSLEYIQSVNDLSGIYIKRKQYDKAEILYQQLVKEVNRENISYPVLLSNQADIYLAKGEYSMAKKILGRSLDALQANEGKDNSYYAATLYKMSQLYYLRGEYAESELLNLESLRIIEKIGRQENLEYYSANLNQLGVTYTYMGLYEEAERYLHELKKLDLDLYGDQDPNFGITLNNLANLYLFRDQMQEAEELYRQSQQIMKDNFGKESVDYALSLNNLAYLYKKSGRYEEAIPLYQESARIYSKFFGKDHPDYARALYNLGNVYMAREAYKDASGYLTNSLSIRRKSIGQNHPRYGESLYSLALLSWNLGLRNETENYFSGMFENYQYQVDHFFEVLSEQEKAAFFNNKLKQGFEIYMNYVLSAYGSNPSLLGEVYNHQLATKGIVLYATSKMRKEVLNSGDSLLLLKYNYWMGIKEQIAGYFSENHENAENDQVIIDSLSRLANTIEKELNVAVRSGESPDIKITWKEVQKSLLDNEAAIEIIRVREFQPGQGGSFTGNVMYVGLVLTSKTTGHPELVLIRNGLEIEKRYLAVYRNSIRFKVDDPHSYDIFWKPFVPHLEGIDNIYLSVDGAYNQISLNTLRHPETNRFLVEDVDIHHFTNTRDLLDYKTSSGKNMEGKIYLFGFPDYNMGLKEEEIKQELDTEDKLDRGLRGMDRSLRGNLRSYLRGNSLLAMLPGTKTEVENISGIYRQSGREPVIYTETGALESKVKNVIQPLALHIATHGFFLDDQVLPEHGNENKYVDNPLLRSGLIMAGVNNFLTRDDALEDLGGEDGILTAYEALNMDLGNTEIVVLSACETGLGQIRNGEGVYGLQRAFQIAGAKSMIMSLWSVDDDATQELMSAFYRNWMVLGDKKKAFVQAQLQVKEKYKDPFYWGAFILIGA